MREHRMDHSREAVRDRGINLRGTAFSTAGCLGDEARSIRRRAQGVGSPAFGLSFFAIVRRRYSNASFSQQEKSFGSSGLYADLDDEAR